MGSDYEWTPVSGMAQRVHIVRTEAGPLTGETRFYSDSGRVFTKNGSTTYGAPDVTGVTWGWLEVSSGK
jgi:IS4 transposase